jgi:hypothetical protein
MPTVTVDWRPAPPPDADDWERAIRDAYTAPTRQLFVRLARRDGGWRIDEARDAPLARTAKTAVSTAYPDPAPPAGDDWRERLTRVLRESGKPVLD